VRLSLRGRRRPAQLGAVNTAARIADEEMGIIARMPSADGRAATYMLAPAGEQLQPVMRALWGWAEKWVPEDPAMAQRDPGVIVWWLAHRVDVAVVPTRQVVLEIAMPGADVPRGWLLTHVTPNPRSASRIRC
jgi:uncharacterized protein (DUF2342 family)